MQLAREHYYLLVVGKRVSRHLYRKPCHYGINVLAISSTCSRRPPSRIFGRTVPMELYAASISSRNSFWQSDDNHCCKKRRSRGATERPFAFIRARRKLFVSSNIPCVTRAFFFILKFVCTRDKIRRRRMKMKRSARRGKEKDIEGKLREKARVPFVNSVVSPVFRHRVKVGVNSKLTRL